MEVMPAFQYPQHILVFVTLLSECIHRSEIEFNSFGPWLYNINLLSISTQEYIEKMYQANDAASIILVILINLHLVRTATDHFFHTL